MKPGWSLKSIGEVCDIVGGGTPSRTVAAFFGGAIPWATVRDMKADWIETTEFSITPAGVKNSATNILPAGAVVVASRVGLGKVCRVRQDTAINQDLRGFTPKAAHQLDPQYLFHWFKSVADKIVAAGTGATVQGVTLPFLRSLEIPLPPLEEQRRIVAVLDEAFAAIATATANAEKNLANAQELLLNAVDRELSAGGSGWIDTTLEAICARFEYGTSTKSQPAGEVPVLRMGNLQNGEIDWSDLVFTNDQAEISQLALRPKDVLFNRTNSLEHVGKAAIFRADRPAIFAGYLIRLHYDLAAVDPEFLNLFLNSRPVRAYGRALAGKSVNQANISAGKLRTYPINLPPLSEQHQIVARLADLRQSTERLQSAQRSKLAALAALKQSLLHRAFAGQLTATAPDFIPA